MAKQPEDKKKPFHPKSELFEFTTDEGVLRVPYIENLKRSHLRVMAGATQDTAMDVEDEFFKLILDADSFKVFEEMTLGEQKTFQEKWDEESAISLGE